MLMTHCSRIASKLTLRLRALCIAQDKAAMAMPVIIAPKDPVLVDKRLDITVLNLRPFQCVTLRVHLLQNHGKPVCYESYGHFIADMDGTVMVAKDASFGGTYKGIDGMGLFWSMLPAPGQRKGARLIAGDVTVPMSFRVSLFDGHVMSESKASSPEEAIAHLPIPLANATILRTYLSYDVERHEISFGRVRGILFVPKGNRRFPGILDMFGSHGGLLEFRAALLASHGFTVLALAFFAYKDLPKSFKDLDIEYFVEAIEWLASHDRVYQNGIGIVGVSFGAQMALQLAVECPRIAAVVAISSPHAILTSVKYNDKSIGYKENWGKGENLKFVDENTLYFAGSYDIESDVVKGVEIEVEKIKGKVLVICGNDDHSLESSKMATRMEMRLAQHKRPRFERVDYPGAGHLIEVPYMPLCTVSFHKSYGIYLLWGGKVVEHSAAQEHSWKAIREFLKKNVLEARPKL